MSRGYFASHAGVRAVDEDELDDHEFETADIRLQGDGIGPLAPYFEALAREAQHSFEVARQARSRGHDPELSPEIPFAEDLASRVEALVGPEHVAERIRALASEMGREELALAISKEVAAGRFGKYDSREEALDAAIRTGLAILTEGILVAPLEGVASVRIRANPDGTEYADVYFAGPIRAAGGTGQALSVLIADVVRRELGLDRYQATKEEVERFKEEIPAYKRRAHLQYTPSPEEIERIVAHLPVSVNGEGTEREEVSGYRDLARVETNQLRGGACLVIAEGLTLKAPKVLKHVEKLGLAGWEFLRDFVDRKDGTDEDAGEATGPRIRPETKYITELVAGRPVLSHPMAKGGFRLRYGRARTAGLASTAVHPALLPLVDDFLAVGTQLKVERPGKGTVVTPCDELEPPIVRLTNGNVFEVRTVAEAEAVRARVESILDLGEMLVPFGEFLENNKLLPGAAWCVEWWEQLVAAAGHEAAPITDAEAAFAFAERTGTPLHPRFTLLWHDLDAEALARLTAAVARGRWHEGRLVLDADDEVKRDLEDLAALHEVRTGDRGRELVVDARCSLPVVRGTGHRVADGAIQQVSAAEGADVLATVSERSGVPVKAKAPCRIGARMGRPEKAALRQMDPPVHCLFPLGHAGGMQRLVQQAAADGTIGALPDQDRARSDQIEIGMRSCPTCGEETLELVCKGCREPTRPVGDRPTPRLIPMGDLLEQALERVGLPKLPPNTKGVRGLISERKLPEPLEKGILRSRHEVFVFKDGTCRFDMTDVPLTHFRPREIGTSVERLRAMGYEHDRRGEALTRDDQVLELLPHDIVINESGLAYLAKVAAFVDDLLVRFYGLKPFYRLEEPRDLIGHLAVGLAPHTSGGVLCRIIGTTRAQVHFAHPYFHAGKRRNCLHPDTEVFVLNSPRPERRRMQQIFEAAEGPERVIDDAGTVARDVAGLAVMAVDPATGAAEPKRVRRILATPAPRTLLRLRTASGRELVCSPAHRLEVIEGSRLSKCKALEVSEGTPLAFPRRLPMPEAPADPLDVAGALGVTLGSYLMVRGVRAEVQGAIAALGGLKAAARIAGLSMKGLDNYRRRDSVPVAVLQALLTATGGDLSALPGTARVATRRDVVEVPAAIAWTPELMRLIGYYLAEGWARGSDGGVFQVSFAATEDEIVEDIQRCCRAVLGLDPSYDGRQITLSGRLVHALFTRVLELGSGAHDKRIPGRIAGLPRTLTAQLLAAYFAGDGTVERGRAHVSCTSVSVGLLRDVGLQLAARSIAYRISSQQRPAGGAAREFYERRGGEVPSFVSHRLSIRSEDAVRFATEIGFTLSRKQQDLEAALSRVGRSRLEAGPGDLVVDRVRTIEHVASDTDWLYDLEVEDHHNFFVNDLLLTSNCDGDEDCVMLLLDGLINFSRWYLPRTRGGQMDAPLTLSTRIDPREIDKEAHNIEVVERYPVAFYEATERNANPREVEELIETVGQRLGGDRQYTDLHYTHDTGSLDEGPAMSAYKTIGSMLEKMEGQLALAHRIHAVDEGNVASRVICDHFLPDIVGNLKAFSRQTMRCAKCNTKYRRVPLSGRCTRCKNKLTMTVHEASVRKYVQVSKQVAERYQVDDYTLQRLRLVEEAIESLFQNDKVKKATLTDFL